MFMGKANLRGIGEQYKFTPEFLEEYFKCAEDIVYFAENYFFVVDIEKGKHKIELYEFQKKSLKIFGCESYKGKKNAIVLMPRQMGKCLIYKELCKIRNKTTGEIMEIPIGDMFNATTIR